MKNLLTIFKPKPSAMKERILKNREALLDVMSQNIKGARQCESLLGAKCLGQFCEKFMEFKSINDETKEETTYWRCAYTQQPHLTIELIGQVRKMNALLEKLLNRKE